MVRCRRDVNGLAKPVQTAVWFGLTGLVWTFKPNRSVRFGHSNRAGETGLAFKPNRNRTGWNRFGRFMGKFTIWMRFPRKVWIYRTLFHCNTPTKLFDLQYANSCVPQTWAGLVVCATLYAFWCLGFLGTTVAKSRTKCWMFFAELVEYCICRKWIFRR